MLNGNSHIVIRLPGTPVGKGRPRFNRKTMGVYTPAKTHGYESRMKWAAKGEMIGRSVMDGAVSVRIKIFLPVPVGWTKSRRAEALLGLLRPTVKPDWDNVAKTLDALNKIVWNDDAQIVDAHVEKWYSADPGLIVEVSKI